MKSITSILLCLLVITSCSSRRQLFSSQSTIHRENGWYHVMQGQEDSIAHKPIITVKDFIALRLDSDYSDKNVIIGQISKHKLKIWGDETEKAIGQRIAFLFNDSVITAPQVNCRLESGTFQISSLSDDNLPTIFKELRKEKIDSIEALFVGWEKDSIYYTISQEQKDSIRFSIDYWEAKGWLDLTTKPEKCFLYDIQDSIKYKKLEKAWEEDRLDSLWRKEEIWQLGATPIKDTQTIHEPPKWAKWDYDLEKYYVSQMKYPKELLDKNVASYSVVMFSIDTLGLPREINILTTNHKEFDKEVIRLTKELPHCLPCRDKNGKRMECLYTVYIPFLPQRYRDRVKADSIAEEELKHCFVEWEEQAKFQDGKWWSPQNYIYQNLNYDARLLGEQQKTKGVYKIHIDSYGEIKEVKTLKSCGLSQWNEKVERIIRNMPRWTPTIHHRGKGEYKDATWAIPVIFKNDCPVTNSEVHDYIWLIKTLSKSCKYPLELQEKNCEGMVYVTYIIGNDGYITNPKIISYSDQKFKEATLNALEEVIDVSTSLPAQKDTLVFQFKLDRPTTPIDPHTDVLVIGYSTCDKPVLMRYDATLTAHTTEPHLEVGVPVCYLNERGDTIVPYGKYRYCQTTTIKDLGFVYENKPKDARIICINDAGKELFYVFKYDNGPDYIQEGLFRIMDENGLIGFADSLGNVVIKPQFKFAYPFKDGKAKVTLKGKRKEVPDSTGEKYYWDSPDWYYINKISQ